LYASADFLDITDRCLADNDPRTGSSVAAELPGSFR
jgi:hypothetical protein